MRYGIYVVSFPPKRIVYVMGISGWTGGAEVAKGKIYTSEIMLWKCVTDSVPSWRANLKKKNSGMKIGLKASQKVRALCSIQF